MRRIIIPMLFIFLGACIEQFDIPAIDQDPVLIVDGAITDQPGPYTVKLSLSSTIGDNLNRPEPVSQALVTIKDDLGNTEVLSEISAGVYQTIETGMHGQVGRKYQLHVVANERQYESSWQEMLPAGEIRDVHAEFFENAINPKDLTKPHDVFKVFVDATGTQNAPNFFRWRWSGIYEYTAHPELRVRFTPDGTMVPDPMPCSGWIFTNNLLIAVAPCTCCTCWAPEFGTDAIISNSEFVSAVDFNHVQVAQIPFEKLKFMNKFYIKVEQLSLTPDVYNFWKKVQAQQHGSTDLFQPNAIKIKGNVYSLTNNDELVLGVFSASAVATKEIFIKRSDVPKFFSDETIIADCRQLKKNATTEKPDFW